MPQRPHSPEHDPLPWLLLLAGALALCGFPWLSPAMQAATVAGVPAPLVYAFGVTAFLIALRAAIERRGGPR